MVNVSIDVTDLGGEARPGDKVVFWRPRMGGSATHAGRVISTAPVTVFLTDGKATVSDVEPGEMAVLLQCRGVESQGPVTVGVPDGDHTVTLRALLESQFEYAPPIVSAVQEAASNASASEEAAIQAQIRSEAAADRAEDRVDDAINNGANLIRNEVKQDADRAVSARQAATQSESNAKASENAAATSASNAATSETNAKQSETNAGDYAAVATTAATEAVDAMERATDLAGGDFATREYVDSTIANALRVDTTVGTRVFAGNTMAYGDTGGRKIEDLATGFDFSTSANHTMTIRRVGNEVTLEGMGTRTEAVAFFTGTLPLGFRPKSGEYRSNRGLALVGTSLVPLGNNNSVLRISSTGSIIDAGARVEFSVQWPTLDSWPTSLPGTPA